jgi:CBS domain-containing protein
MLVSEIRHQGNVDYCTDAPVLDAVRVMAQHDIGSLVVMDGGASGLVTLPRYWGAGRSWRRARRPGSGVIAGETKPLTAAPMSTSWNLTNADARAHAMFR